MTAYADLVPEVLEAAPGCPEPLIERNIRNSVIELCSRALILRRTLSPITLQAGVSSYVLTPPDSRQIVEVFSATINAGKPLQQKSSDHLDLLWQEQSACSFRFDNVSTETSPMGEDWRTYTQYLPEVFFTERDDNNYKIRLVGIPIDTLANALSCRVVLKPTRDSTEVDDWILEDYYSLLLSGAKAKTLLVPQTKWFQPQLGAMFVGLFDDGLEAARLKALRDFNRDDESTGHVKAWV